MVKVIGGIIVAVLALIGALVVAASLSPSTTATRSTCAELADEAVRISAEQNTGTLKPLLLKVRDTAVVVDDQNDLTPPASGERTLLECRGVGVFSGLPNTTVVLRMTVDSDGDVFVAYEAG